jgi:hypothetical protein
MHPAGMSLTGVHLIDVYLTSVYLIGVCEGNQEYIATS